MTPLVRDLMAARLDSAVPGLPRVIWADAAGDPADPHVLATVRNVQSRPIDSRSVRTTGETVFTVRFPMNMAAQAEDLGDAIEAALPATGALSDLGQAVYVESTCAQAGAPERDWWTVPVVVSWSAFR